MCGYLYWRWVLCPKHRTERDEMPYLKAMSRSSRVEENGAGGGICNHVIRGGGAMVRVEGALMLGRGSG